MKRQKPRRQVVRLAGRSIVAVGQQRRPWSDFSHRAMVVSWPVFIASVALIILMLNGLFAVLYVLGRSPVAHARPGSFSDLFYFSVETLSTVGYGDMHPQTQYGHVIATVESFTGIFFIALMTGLIYARFSRPRARILFSDVATIAKRDGVPTLAVRMANERHNYISDAHAALWLLSSVKTKEGRNFRGFEPLTLMRADNPAFALSWALFHVIDASSPLYGKTAEDLADDNAQFVLNMTGYDETSAQTIHARKVYDHEDVLWGKHFVDILRVEDSVAMLDYNRFHDSEEE